MRGHGVAVAGNSIEEAVVRTIMLENACEDQVILQSLGGDLVEFDRDDVDRLCRTLDRPEQYIVNFDYLARKAKRGLAA